MQQEDGYIGIDPGAKGAICLLIPRMQHVEFRNTTEKPDELFAWFKEAQGVCNLRIAMIENVHAIQGTSAGSNFKFGYNVGMVTGIARCAGAPLDLVNPKKWQGYIKVKAKGGPAIKKAVGEISERLYPSASIRGPRGGLLDGRSDALMIAHYASHLYK